MVRKVVIVLAACLGGCGQAEEPSAQNEPAAPATAPSAAAIDPGVYEPYLAENGWSKTVAKWGPDGMKRVQALREAAAETVSRNPACDAVELSEISDSRSSPPTRPVVYVDCRNAERFYLGEDDVKVGVASEKQLGSRFSSSELIEQCTEAVRSRLNLPSTFDRDMFGVSDYQGTSGNRVIRFTFTAKNRLGAELPASAECVMTTQGKMDVSLIED